MAGTLSSIIAAAGIPRALRSPIAHSKVNAPIGLFSGQLSIGASGSRRTRGRGSISVEWLPSPRIAFAVTTRRWAELGPIEVYIPRLAVGVPATATSISGRSAGRIDTAGILDQGVRFAAAAVRRITFVILNYPDFLGRAVAVSPTEVRAGRVQFEKGPWQLTLDPHQSTTELTTNLRLVGGYAITHVGEIRRTDGAAFRFPDSADVLDGFGYFLSFAGGGWAMPQLLHGYEGQRLPWREWRLRFTQPWRGGFHWLPALEGGAKLEDSGLRFLDKWSDPIWHDPLRRAVYFFVLANGDISESGLIMAQTLLESLAWAVVVRARNALSREGFEKLTAADQIRILLSLARIPSAVPSALRSLGAYRIGGRAPIDGPEALTYIRNQSVHPPRPGSRAVSTEELVDAWKLATWYAELAILAIIGYRGTYLNRVDGRETGLPF